MKKLCCRNASLKRKCKSDSLFNNKKRLRHRSFCLSRGKHEVALLINELNEVETVSEHTETFFSFNRLFQRAVIILSYNNCLIITFAIIYVCVIDDLIDDLFKFKSNNNF